MLQITCAARAFRLSVFEPQKFGPQFEIHNSSFDILRFQRLQEYLLHMNRMRSGPFEGPKTVKPPALPDTYSRERQLLTPIPKLLFAEYIEYSGSSAAAAVIHGGHANGLTIWKNKQGKTLKELESLQPRILNNLCITAQKHFSCHTRRCTRRAVLALVRCKLFILKDLYF
jgi:hypothetical protein